MKSTGFLRILVVILVTLKLTELISWDWIWVISPIWIVASIYGVTQTIVETIERSRAND